MLPAKKYFEKSLITFISYCLLFIFLFSSCKKTDVIIDKTLSKEVTIPSAFFKLAANARNEEKVVVNNLQMQFDNSKATENFLHWHGQPLWDKSVLYKKDENHFKLYIPVKKDSL